MKSLNRVTLIGNIGRDPELRNTANGDTVATLSLATSESWKDKTSGETVERTEWHRCVVWRKLAEIVGQYCHKGDRIYVEGKLQTRKWQDKDGQDKYATEILVDNLLMLGGKSGGSGSAPTPSPADTSHRYQAPAGPAEDFDDDIPF